MSRSPVRKNRNGKTEGDYLVAEAGYQKGRGQPRRRQHGFPHNLERSNGNQIAPSDRAKAGIMKNIRVRFWIERSPERKAVGIRSALLVLAAHSRFSPTGETAKTSDAK